MKVVAFAGVDGCGKDTAAAEFVSRGFVRVGFADRIKRLAREIYGFSEQQLFGSTRLREEPIGVRGSDPEYWFRAERATSGMCIEKWFPVTIDDGGLYSVAVTLMADLLARSRAFGPSLTPRFVLRHLGTEVGRAVDPDNWVKLTVSDLRAIRDGASYTSSGGVGTGVTHGELPCACGAQDGVVIPDLRFANEAVALRGFATSGEEIDPYAFWIDDSVRRPQPAGVAIHASLPTRERFLSDGEDYMDGDLDNNGTLAEFEAAVSFLADSLNAPRRAYGTSR